MKTIFKTIFISIAVIFGVILTSKTFAQIVKGNPIKIDTLITEKQTLEQAIADDPVAQALDALKAKSDELQAKKAEIEILSAVEANAEVTVNAEIVK